MQMAKKNRQNLQLDRIRSDLTLKLSHQPFRQYGIDDATPNDLKIEEKNHQKSKIFNQFV